MASTSLKVGTRVRMLIDCEGDVNDTLVKAPAGSLGTVISIDLYPPPQGVSITIELDCGVINVFDQGDDPGLLEITTTPRPPRTYTVLLRGMTTATVEVTAASEEEAAHLALCKVEEDPSTRDPTDNWEVEHVEIG